MGGWDGSARLNSVERFDTKLGTLLISLFSIFSNVFANQKVNGNWFLLWSGQGVGCLFPL